MPPGAEKSPAAENDGAKQRGTSDRLLWAFGFGVRRRRGLAWNEPQAPDGAFAGDTRDPAARAAVVAALDDVHR
jgi:hypothetical protein